jgi:hypothetical protein
LLLNSLQWFLYVIPILLNNSEYLGNIFLFLFQFCLDLRKRKREGGKKEGEETKRIWS